MVDSFVRCSGLIFPKKNRLQDTGGFLTLMMVIGMHLFCQLSSKPVQFSKNAQFDLEPFASSGVGTFRNWKYRLDKYKALRVPEKKNGRELSSLEENEIQEILSLFNNKDKFL